jgi:hypothetical protein
MSARAREKDRLTRPIHVRRADVQISFRADDGFLVEVPARGLLNDFSEAGFCVYATEHLNPNVEVNLEIHHPKHFRLTAKIVWCQYQPSSAHVLTTQSFPYRVGLALIFKDAALEAEFRNYCDQLGNLYVNAKALALESAFQDGPAAGSPAETPMSAAPVAAFNEVPAPIISDEGAAPSEDQVAAEMAAAKAAEVAAEAMKKANPEGLVSPDSLTAPSEPETSTAAILDALKDAA